MRAFADHERYYAVNTDGGEKQSFRRECAQENHRVDTDQHRVLQPTCERAIAVQPLLTESLCHGSSASIKHHRHQRRDLVHLPYVEAEMKA
jgi:hypothetical protein